MSYSGNPDAPHATNPNGPLVPSFPHLPDWAAGPIAAFDREVNTPVLPLDSDGHPHIPESTQAWLADNVKAHTHFEPKE